MSDIGNKESVITLAASEVYYEWNAATNRWTKLRDSDPEPDPSLPPGKFDGQVTGVPRIT